MNIATEVIAAEKRIRPYIRETIIDAVLAALGGGGLISGIAAYLKSIHPGVEIIGCSPQNSQVMIRSVKAGKILDLPSLATISDATAGGIAFPAKMSLLLFAGLISVLEP